MANRSLYLTIFIMLLFAAWTLLPVSGIFFQKSDAYASGITACPSGRMFVRLTGWSLNDKMPRGTASFDEKSRQLEVTVDSVNLPDGRRLAVLVGDDRIGEMEALKGGSAGATLTRSLKEGDRVRVFDGERPIVSGNLACDNSQPLQTPTPSPTASPTPLPSVTPTATPEPTITPGGKP